jgi:protocatechuate 3,4-dioxygenase beta subunit
MNHDTDTENHHHGLSHDLRVLQARLNRRRWLEWAACLGASALGCSGDGGSAAGGDGGAGLDDAGNLASDGTCTTIPDETGGPYPGDGTNGPNALTLNGIVRSDIRSSIATATGTAGGVTLTVELRLMDNGCVPLPGFAVYIWHCDREGRYSMYSAGAENENYLRGVQVADDAGVVTFTTVFPACYTGRWPHIHFEIYESVEAASTGANAVKTSQLALPESACDEVFATSGYEASVTNLSGITLATDNVFRDGVDLQVPSITGDVDAGYAVRLDVAVPLG